MIAKGSRSSDDVCRYYLRYIQPWNQEAIADKAAEQYWMPVDLYVGKHAPLVATYSVPCHPLCLSLSNIGALTLPQTVQQ